MLKFVSSGILSEPYNQIFNNDCLFYITGVSIAVYQCMFLGEKCWAEKNSVLHLPYHCYKRLG